MMDGSMMGGWGGYGLLAGLLGLMLFVGLLGVFAWAAVSILPSRGAPSARSEQRKDPAEEILRVRFARGELSAEEFEKAVRILRREPVQGNYEYLAREGRER